MKQATYWNVAEENGTYQKVKWLLIYLLAFKYRIHKTKFHILIFVHLWSRWSCWLFFISISLKTTWSAQEIKTSPGTHIQAPKTDFRCHGHDLRSTKNSQTLFRTEFSNMTIDKFCKLIAIRILKLSLDLSFFIKEALQVFWVQRYDLLSQINYHKYLQSMDKSMCQWINQSINKSIYKCPKTPWLKVLIQSKRAHFYSPVYSKLNLNFFHKSCGRFIIFYFLLS